MEKKIIMPQPTGKQWEFIRDRHKFLAYGGSRGGGKSFGVRIDAIYKAMEFPGIKIMIVRKTYPELQANHIGPLCELLACYGENPAAKYNEQKKQMKFGNGSVIIFRYCDTDKDAERFQGTECDVLYVDEATQQPEERIKKLTACVRGVNRFPKLVRYTCNPGGVGHEWVKRLFIDRRFNANEKPEDYAFIQSSVYDNVMLMKTNPDYIRQLEALPGKLRDMWLYGRWDVAEGQFFEEFRAEPDLAAAAEAGLEMSAEELRKYGRFTHVIAPMDLSAGRYSGWRFYRSYDFGYGKPFSCGWWCVDYDGVLYRILELYGCTGEPNEGVKWTPQRQFEEIARIEREHPWLKGRKIIGVADPAIWDASRGESIADVAAKQGLYFTPGDHQRVPGWMQCHYRLQFDEEGYPRMYVFENCEAFIRTVPGLVYDRHRVEDLDTGGEDHVADEWRYLCMSMPIAPERPAEEREIWKNPLG